MAMGAPYLSTTILDIVTPANRKGNFATGVARSKGFERQSMRQCLTAQIFVKY